MYSADDLALIIQGPLTSKGKDGEHAGIPSNELDPEDLAEINCRDTIGRVIDDFKNLFDSIVISTWDEEIEKGDNWKDAELATMPDPGGSGEWAWYKANNKYRQFIGIKKGIEKLKKINDEIKYVVRIRTDQWVNLPLIVDSLNRYISRENYINEKLICVPYIYWGDSPHVTDFYFASRLENMEKFCNAMLAYNMFEFAHSVHKDIPLKYGYSFKDKTGVEDQAFFPRSFQKKRMSKGSKKVFNFLFKRVFAPCSKKVFEELNWRGSRIRKRFPYEGKIFEESIKNENGNLENLFTSTWGKLPPLFSTNWDRYYRFLENHREDKDVSEYQKNINTYLSDKGLSLGRTLLNLLNKQD